MFERPLQKYLHISQSTPVIEICNTLYRLLIKLVTKIANLRSLPKEKKSHLLFSKNKENYSEQQSNDLAYLAASIEALTSVDQLNILLVKIANIKAQVTSLQKLFGVNKFSLEKEKAIIKNAELLLSFENFNKILENCYLEIVHYKEKRLIENKNFIQKNTMEFASCEKTLLDVGRFGSTKDPCYFINGNPLLWTPKTIDALELFFVSNGVSNKNIKDFLLKNTNQSGLLFCFHEIKTKLLNISSSGYRFENHYTLNIFSKGEYEALVNVTLFLTLKSLDMTKNKSFHTKPLQINMQMLIADDGQQANLCGITFSLAEKNDLIIKSIKLSKEIQQKVNQILNDIINNLSLGEKTKLEQNRAIEPRRNSF